MGVNRRWVEVGRARASTHPSRFTIQSTTRRQVVTRLLMVNRRWVEVGGARAPVFIFNRRGMLRTHEQKGLAGELFKCLDVLRPDLARPRIPGASPRPGSSSKGKQPPHAKDRAALLWQRAMNATTKAKTKTIDNIYSSTE